MANADISDSDRFDRIARELKTIREQLGTVLFAIHDAESEVPEKMRRFMMYMHDMHDIAYMFEERGLPVPKYIHRELERCDDRLRQLLSELHMDDGAFSKIKKEMAKDPANRWDHTKRLPPPTHLGDQHETRPSNDVGNGVDKEGTDPARG